MKTTRMILLFLLLLVIAGSLITCSKQVKSKTEYTRIMEIISRDNIIETPLQDIISTFNHVDEDIIKDWKFIPSLSDDTHEVWAASTAHVPLVRNRFDRPEGMKLWKNGDEVPYLDTSQDSERAWKWISTSENLDLTSDERYVAKYQGVRLNRGQSIQFERIFSKSMMTIDLHILNPNWAQYRPRLQILFDGKNIKEIKVSRRKKFRVHHPVEMGYHTVSIEYSHQQETSTPNEFVVVGEIRLTNSSDVILLSKTFSGTNAPPEGEYTLEYYTFDAVPELEAPAVSDDIVLLYNFQSLHNSQDEGIIENPYSLKKKIRSGEHTLNLLIAPSPSTFTVPVTIPDDGVLDFGYGFHLAIRKKAPNPTYRFLITADHSGEKEILWSQDLNPDSDELMNQARIDLSSYRKKRVNLSFITEKISPSTNKIEGVICLPVWENPVMYVPTKTKPLNIILISMDTLRPDHLGCYGYGHDTSPAIDEFSEDAALFKNVYSTTSWTLPAHVSLLTALNCSSHKVYFPFQRMDPQNITLADMLRSNGYYTASFTGGGYLSPSYGFAKGFDTYHSMRLGGDTDVRLDEAERLSKTVCQWLENNAEKAFFLFLHTYQPHDPYANLSEFGRFFLADDAKWDQVKMETLFGAGGRFDTHLPEDEIQNVVALYDGEIRYMDETYIRPILKKMKELELYDDSLIILTSDHGEEFYEHESWLHDHSIYDESVKIPLIMKFPNSEHEGTTVDQIVRITDIMPTILDALGIKSSSVKMDGESLLPLLTGKEKNDRTFMVDLALRNYRDMYPTVIATNGDNFKIILNKEINSPYTTKISKTFNGIKTELYNLAVDPGETKNRILHIEHRDLSLRLAKQITEHYRKLEAEILKKDDVVMDQDLIEQLRALGYIR
jgi:arylsulfatase A-like enzyme